jgi:NitT/TauT family transport system permease protein
VPSTKPYPTRRDWKSSWVARLALVFSVLVAIGVHGWITRTPETTLGGYLREVFGQIWFVKHVGTPPVPIEQVPLYTRFLGNVFYVALLLTALHSFWGGLRRWFCNLGPIFAAAVLFLCGWETITAGLTLLPTLYFPEPGRVLHAIISDRQLLWESTWHSLLLLSKGYLIGSLAGVITGVSIGWFPAVRYWGMPVVKVLGPIPAAAWIPLVMVVFSGTTPAVMLVALAVWFPVTMLTASGISNTRVSYLDVARTLGAGRMYLIFRVAMPAAMPNLFLGLFMGLGTSFLTLIAAESVGVRAGLGWYIDWARTNAEYGKVYAALVIMAAFFSTIMTILFKLRDWVLVWQKGTIKW